MKTKTGILRSIKQCLINYNWLILAFTFFFLLSCSAPRSVRLAGSQNYKSSNQKKAKIVEDEYAFKTDTDNDETDLKNKTSESSETDEDNSQDIKKNGKRKILTLREQMKVYEQEQEETKGRLTEIESDIRDIKHTIAGMNDNQKGNKYTKAEAIAGFDSEEAPVKNYHQKKKDSKVILSDEEVSKKETKTNLPVVKSEKKQIAERKSKAVKIKEPVKNVKNVKNTKLSKPEPKKQIPAEPQKVEKSKKESDVNPTLDKAVKIFASKDYPKAIDELTKVLGTSREPSVLAKANYWLGESYFAMKQYEKAVSYFQRVLRIKNAPMQDNAQMMIAESHIRSGQLPEAKKAYKLFVDNYPNSEYLPRARKMLQQL